MLVAFLETIHGAHAGARVMVPPYPARVCWACHGCFRPVTPGAGTRPLPGAVYPGRVAHRAPDPQDRPRPAGRPSRGDAPLISRQDLGGWIEGPGAGSAGGRWPGDLLGLPQHGPTSMATAARRAGALVVDWAIALGISGLLFAGDPIATLLIFAAMHVVGLSLLATTVGKALCRIQVVAVGGRTAPVHRVLLRTALLCLILPAVVVGPDGRGMHDRAAGTVELRM